MSSPIWDIEGTVGYAWDDLAVSFESPIWQEDIFERLRDAMARVAHTDGFLLVGVYMGFLKDIPHVDEDEIRPLPVMTGEELKAEAEAGNLGVIAEINTKLVQIYYETLGEARDFLSLHIHEITP